MTVTSENFAEQMKNQAVAHLEIQIEKYLTHHFENVIVPRVRDELISRVVFDFRQTPLKDGFDLSIRFDPKL